jgi:hypothetical protein
VGRDEKTGRKKYESPTVTPVTMAKLPVKARAEVAKLVSETTSEGRNPPSARGEIRFELSLEGKFKRVSEGFCALLGFAESELLGQPVDSVTASGALHIPHHLGAVVHFGCFHCLWMFVHGDGHAVLVRTDWSFLPDMSMEVYCELVPVFV